MSPWARYVGALVTGLIVTTWAWLHGPFNGASLLVILILAFAALALWIREHAEAERKGRDYWIDPKDGV